MFNIGPEELLLILVIALIFVGPKRLPDMARQVGKGLREFRNITGNAKRELMDSVKVDLNAQPGLADGGVDIGDDTPVDISSLPVWDGTTDQPQVPGVNTPVVDATPPNGSSSKSTKPVGKAKKKKTETSPSAAEPAIDQPAPAARRAPTKQAGPLKNTASVAGAEAGDGAETTVSTDPVEP